MTDYLIFKYEGRDLLGMPIVSCRRPGGGLVGYGASNGLALADFEQKESELCPSPAEREIESSIDDELDRGELQ